MDTTQQQRTYQAPCLVEYGSLQAVTTGSQQGEHLDQAFPAGTPQTDLAFS